MTSKSRQSPVSITAQERCWRQQVVSWAAATPHELEPRTANPGPGLTNSMCARTSTTPRHTRLDIYHATSHEQQPRLANCGVVIRTSATSHLLQQDITNITLKYKSIFTKREFKMSVQLCTWFSDTSFRVAPRVLKNVLFTLLEMNEGFLIWTKVSFLVFSFLGFRHQMLLNLL